MKIEEFGNDLDESALFLMDSLETLHKGYENIDKELAIKMVPYYKYYITDDMDIEEFMKIIDFSSILSEYHIKMVFMDDLLEIPLISPEEKYYSLEERIDFLIESLGENKLIKLHKNTYLFFNH